MQKPYFITSVSVCYKCEKRAVGCHSCCELYLEAKEKAEEDKERIRQIKRDEFITQSGNKARQKEAIRRWYRKYGV